MYGVSRRIVLRINESHCFDWKLLFGIVFSSLSDSVLQLPCWIVPTNRGLFKLSGMSWRFVLRVVGPSYHDWCLCSWKVRGRVFKHMLKLLVGIICIVCIFNELLELPCGILSGTDWFNNVYGMPRRIKLCNNGSHSCERKLRIRFIFSNVCNSVLKLPCRLLSSDFRIFKLSGMSWRCVLRDDGSNCRD